VYHTLITDVPHVQRPADALAVTELLETAFAVSRSQARTLVQQGSVAVNGAKLALDAASLSAADAVRGRWFVLRKGARDIAIVEISRG
jgi:tyrosyl-tRNA synthetase